MLERDKVHLARTIGAMMESAEQDEATREAKGLSVSIHAPCDNRIVVGDYIEVNIHLPAGAECERREVQEMVAAAMDAIGNTRTQRK